MRATTAAVARAGGASSSPTPEAVPCAAAPSAEPPRSAADARDWGEVLSSVADRLAEAGWEDNAADVYVAAGGLLERADRMEGRPEWA